MSELTREQVLGMEAGPEMDELVAVMIMGYESSKVRNGWVELGNFATYPKRYSTDIAAAWEVVEKVREKGWGMAIVNAFSQEPDGPGYGCHLRNGMKTHTGYAETAPLAICRAALLTTIQGE